MVCVVTNISLLYCRCDFYFKELNARKYFKVQKILLFIKFKIPTIRQLFAEDSIHNTSEVAKGSL